MHSADGCGQIISEDNLYNIVLLQPGGVNLGRPRGLAIKYAAFLFFIIFFFHTRLLYFFSRSDLRPYSIIIILLLYTSAFRGNSLRFSPRDNHSVYLHAFCIQIRMYTGWVYTNRIETGDGRQRLRIVVTEHPYTNTCIFNIYGQDRQRFLYRKFVDAKVSVS